MNEYIQTRCWEALRLDGSYAKILAVMVQTKRSLVLVDASRLQLIRLPRHLYFHFLPPRVRGVNERSGILRGG